MPLCLWPIQPAYGLNAFRTPENGLTAESRLGLQAFRPLGLPKGGPARLAVLGFYWLALEYWLAFAAAAVRPS